MAKFCTQCGIALEEDSKFCFKCGAPVRQKPVVVQEPVIPKNVCPACGAKLKAGAEFCASCGLKLVADQVMTPDDVMALYDAHLISLDDCHRMLNELYLEGGAKILEKRD